MTKYNQPRYPFNKQSFERLQESLHTLELPEDEYEDLLERERIEKMCVKCGGMPRLYGLHDNGMCNDCWSMRHVNK